MNVKKVVRTILALAMVYVAGSTTEAAAQTDTAQSVVIAAKAAKKPGKRNWSEIISVRGYAQVRYNRLLETNPLLKCDQCDKSLGEGGGVFLRRARLVFSGNVHERVYFYVQPDLASSPGSGKHNFLQLRDAYFDVALDKQKAFRLRIGQSKVPYGYENMQSSSNRIVLDRNDALNSAIANERDLGVFFYWTPPEIRARLKELTNSELKGAGDYGMFGFGVYNGQTANRPEANNSLHMVARMTYPFKLPSGQFIEPGIQAYTGKYVVTPEQVSSGVTVLPEYTDQRVAASIAVYPQPFGFQAEYNIGRGPEYDVATRSVQVKPLKGGYAQAIYKIEVGDQLLLPFVKVQYYQGGKKHERDATAHQVYETEIGAEWQPFRNFELVADYSIGDRTTANASTLYNGPGDASGNGFNRQFGSRLRLQAQFNF
ncbi:porin [Pontibacter beigongshangensis]|uniref:porin n=1 Tax=Pontibacter beigongshangensis TaxID=2574733 RepID=UPI00164F01D0|nr:porin [Pontibacter beigongshangensis]